MNSEQPQPQTQGMTNELKNNITNTTANASRFITDMKQKFNNMLAGFSSEPGADSQFSSSNTIIAKFAFLVLVLIVFVIFINLGISLLIYFIMPQNDPYVIKGMISGSQPVTVTQDPNNSNSVLILKSNNEKDGMEFTWSTWLYLDDLGNSPTLYQHIFNKGDNIYNSDTNISSVNNAPGLYLSPAKNELHVIMNTVSNEDAVEIIDINNIPIKKWFNVIIRLKNTILDVYINGTISGRLILKNVPKQNYNNVYACQNGGFTGKLADLRYFSRALSIFEINSVVSSGPDTNTSKLDLTVTSKGNYAYLSNLWYASKL
jgi:hypothetical protein